jgi:hypothetical protein
MQTPQVLPKTAPAPDAPATQDKPGE